MPGLYGGTVEVEGWVGWGWVIDGSASAFVYPAGLVWISPVLLLLMHSTLKENRAFVL